MGSHSNGSDSKSKKPEKKFGSVGGKFKSAIRKLIRKGFASLPPSYRFEFMRNQLKLDYKIPPNLTFNIARSQEDLEAAFKLLHDSYVDSGFMQPHPSGLRVTKYHALPSTTTLVAKLDGKVVGTTSLIRSSLFGLPMENSFDLTEIKKGGRRVVEISSLAVDKSFRGNHGEIFLPLVKYFVKYSFDFFGVDHFVIAVNPARADLFEGVFLFTRLNQTMVNNYSFVNGAPAVGLELHAGLTSFIYASHYYRRSKAKDLHNYLFRSAPFAGFKLPDRKVHTISDPVMTPELLDYFFNQKTQTFSELSQKEIQILHELYLDLPHTRVLPPIESNLRNLKSRRQRRHDVSFLGELTLADGSKTRVRVNSVSLNGIQIQSENLLPKENWLNLRIAVSEFEVAKAEVRVAWHDGSQLYGLHVTNGDESFTRVIDFLDNRLRNLNEGDSESERLHLQLASNNKRAAGE